MAIVAAMTLQTTWILVYAMDNRQEKSQNNIAGSTGARGREKTGTKVAVIQWPEIMPESNFSNATDNKISGSAPTKAADITSEEISTIKIPTDPQEQPNDPKILETATTKPSERAYDSTATLMNDSAVTQAPVILNQGSYSLILLILAGFCCIFLLLWGWKRRSSLFYSSTASGNANTKGSKVQYTHVPNEQPFSHCQYDDDEFCDDFTENDLANDCESWDDWENSSSQDQVSQINPFASAPSILSPRIIPNATTGHNSQLLHSSHHQFNDTATLNRDADPTSLCDAVIEIEKERESCEDLFSQFGMKPDFKKHSAAYTT
ncbi:uncharacterized protein PHALS_01492 [Plasmopara halstedii]|uniref:RxLR-like protein n=1 Tax=Plasmopara halstedii TaxID=4781 RepID=A0A0P1ASQ2_PLAHL|nr:uncharacterized protein PHALS_01492 [Plasmopara halstedii]CEG45177.1 hypothetical protein PHALS_01492 [Plasmopara halstedii]|eukprot:XP_024581546.1 hypothetical protein PHALS_01492 [Plasmopara halstedii]